MISENVLEGSQYNKKEVKQLIIEVAEETTALLYGPDFVKTYSVRISQ